MNKNVRVLDRQAIIPTTSSSLQSEHGCDQFSASSNADARAISRADLAKHIYEMRRLRDRFLSPDLLAEPGWDILLFLYWAEKQQQRMSVSAVSASAGVPATTALRWIQKLLEMEMLEKQQHPTDHRVSWLALSGRAKVALDGYLATVFTKSCN